MFFRIFFRKKEREDIRCKEYEQKTEQILLHDSLLFVLFYDNCFVSAVEVKNWTLEHYITNQSSCQQILENLDVLSEIPLLNDAQLHDIRDKQLIRFRGMIQDMYDPEYYLKQYEVKNTKTGKSDVRCGMYTDTTCLVNCLLLSPISS